MDYRVIVYSTERGREPFSNWLKSLKDKQAQRLVLLRIQRIRTGNFGDSKNITKGAGVRELRIPYGPGLRVYYATVRGQIVLLLGGGSKRTQEKDIENAKECLREYKERV